MPDLPEKPIGPRPGLQEYIIGGVDPFALARIAAELLSDPNTEVVSPTTTLSGPASPPPSVITVKTTPDHLPELKARLEQTFPGVIIEENRTLGF